MLTNRMNNVIGYPFLYNLKDNTRLTKKNAATVIITTEAKNMSHRPFIFLNLAEMVPNAIGMIAFDNDGQIIEAVGIGKERKEDVLQLQQVELDDEGFGLLEYDNIQVLIYKKEEKTIAVYTHSGK
ncbi:hypothetical protein C6P43_000823 [Kluyveromyces marxianus]|nr:hypothetical protein C6P43_000823 [Kluyveromyces marxianus]